MHSHAYGSPPAVLRRTGNRLDRRRCCAAALLIAVFLGACGDSPVDPGRSERNPLSLGTEATGQFATGQRSDTLYYRVPAGQSASLRVESNPLGVGVSVRDGVELAFALTVVQSPAGAFVDGAGSDRDRVLQLVVTDARLLSGADTMAAMSWRVVMQSLDPSPETGSDVLDYGDVVSGVLSAPVDVDRYRLNVESGDTFAVFLRVLDAHGVAAIIRRDTALSALKVTAGPHPVHRGAPVGPVPAGDATHTIRLENLGVIETGSAVRYTLELLRMPSRAASRTVLPINVLVDAELSPYGDIDDYMFEPDVGDLLRLYVYADSITGLTGEVRAPDKLTMEELHYDATLGAWVTQPFATASATYTVELRHDPTVHLDPLPYTIRLFRADRSPETLPEALVREVLLTGEVIDSVADVDEFTFTLGDSSIVNSLRFMPPPANTWDVVGRILLADGAEVDAQELGTSETGMQLTAMLPPGTYRLRFAPGGTYTGPYSFVFATGSRLPEDVSATLVIGDTITESLGLISDQDHFQLTLAGPDRVKVGLHSGALPGGDEMWLNNLDMPGVYAMSPPGGQSLTFNPGAGFAGPGTYRLAVTMGQAGPSWEDRGTYRLAVVHMDTLLEAGGPPLSPGDSSTAEAIDHADDVDRFRVVGTPGTTVRVQLAGERSGVTMQVFDAENDRWTPGLFAGSPYLVTSEAVTIPPVGHLVIDVMQWCGATQNCTTPLHYTLHVLPGQ